jgi:DNA-directed RNA polymerase specialized sigma24 family protein
MPVRTEIGQNEFDKMLRWLASDPEAAGRAYERIRIRLIKLFYARGCSIAEELADETIDRVVKKIEWLAEFFEGDQTLYFLGVARNVFLEYSRKPRPEELPAVLIAKEESDDLDLHHECLSKCLARLPEKQCELILGYYEGTKRAKIDHRKQLVELLGMTNQALRVRVLRLRVSLRKCVVSCVERNLAETF